MRRRAMWRLNHPPVMPLMAGAHPIALSRRVPARRAAAGRLAAQAPSSSAILLGLKNSAIYVGGGHVYLRVSMVV